MGFVSFAGAATSIILVTTKDVFCRDKSMLVMTKLLCLLRQNILLQQKYFVATKLCLLQQAYFCCNKRRVCCNKTFVATKMILVAAPANDCFEQSLLSLLCASRVGFVQQHSPLLRESRVGFRQQTGFGSKVLLDVVQSQFYSVTFSPTCLSLGQILFSS